MDAIRRRRHAPGTGGPRSPAGTGAGAPRPSEAEARRKWPCPHRPPRSWHDEGWLIERVRNLPTSAFALASAYGAPNGAPYVAEDVRLVVSANTILAATLTLPVGVRGPMPAVVLLHGSSPSDRMSSTAPCIQPAANRILSVYVARPIPFQPNPTARVSIVTDFGNPFRIDGVQLKMNAGSKALRLRSRKSRRISWAK